MKPEIITIGVYGFDEDAFFQALVDANVDLFVDIRQRRGLRGPLYAFANSQRLQARLAGLGIRYLHRKDLAPTPAVRAIEKEADKTSKIAKRERQILSSAFRAAYRSEVLAHFDPQSLLDDLQAGEHVIVLFCVERAPRACHRSLVADKLARTLQLKVTHITP